MMKHRYKKWSWARCAVWFGVLCLARWAWAENVADAPPPPDPEVVALLGRWHAPSSIDRIHAAQGMAARGDPGFAPLLAVGALDKIWLVRLAAVKALGQVATRMEIETLVGALKDPFTEIRVEAAQALGRRGDERAWEPLINGLKDREAAVRAAHAEALRRLTGQDFGEDRRAWQRWYRANRAEIESAQRRIAAEVAAERERLTQAAKAAEEERLREPVERTRAMQTLPIRSQSASPDANADRSPRPDL
ncbi:MAG: HEAT repeat domain-containing protein [Candidatus Marinimicrobia bacterium]|nr:HEAT repeat domain-containing protein [Candidatus Neomarinimicrobiota bacterium]